MNPLFLTTLLALAAMCFANVAHAAECRVVKQDGTTLSGHTCEVTGDIQGEPGPPGSDGVDGADGRDGLDFQSDESLALGAALSLPAWLQKNETVRISGGLGFSDGGETAIGATGVVRIDQNWAAFGGAAVNTQGGAWAGNAGISVGF